MADQEDDLSKPLQDNLERSYERRKPFQQQSEQVGLAEAAITQKVVEHQLAKDSEHWVRAYWRPSMAWLYMAICFMDFIGFPFLAGVQPIVYKIVGIAAKYEPWVSLTLQNGGLVHAAFGAILGVAAWTRGQEKISR